MLGVVMLNVVMLSVPWLNVVVLKVTTIDFTPCVVFLNVVVSQENVLFSFNFVLKAKLT